MASKRQRRKRRRRAAELPTEQGDAQTPVRKPVPMGTAVGTQRVPARRAGAGASPRIAHKGAPPAPWGSFPLSELVVLIALILLVAGFFVPPPRGAVMLGAGLVLGSLAGVELGGPGDLCGYPPPTPPLSGAGRRGRDRRRRRALLPRSRIAGGRRRPRLRPGRLRRCRLVVRPRLPTAIGRGAVSGSRRVSPRLQREEAPRTQC